MILMTMIARAADGLPLAASVQDDEEADQNLVKYQSQAKLLFRKLNQQSPARCTLESGPYVFHYLIEQGVCYLCLCDRNFPNKLAFGFLESLSAEFNSNYGRRVDTVSRPYHFIEFDAFIQQAKKRFTDTRGRHQLTGISSELQDVQRIMVQNIEDVLHRGESLNILEMKSNDLAMMSKKYKQDARYLNLRSTYMKIGAVVLIIVLVLLYVRFWWG